MTNSAARIGSKVYATLAGAIKSARNGDTIYICNDCVIDENIICTKNVIIKPEYDDAVIYMSGGDREFFIGDGASSPTVRIEKNGDKKIIFDGENGVLNRIDQHGMVEVMNGHFYADGAEFRHSNHSWAVHEKTEDTDSDISALSATAAAGEVGFQFKIKNGMNNVLSDSKYVGYQITSTAPLEVGVYSFSAFITGEIDIPQTVIYDNVEYKVTSILASADWLEATKLVIPEGVTTIEERALKSNDNLAEIDLPASLTSFKT